MYLSGTKYAALALGCVLSLSATAKNTVPSAGQGCGKPLCFIENKGQLTDANGKPVTGIQYQLSTTGMNLYVGNGALHYQFRKVTEGETPIINAYRMDVRLVGANKNASVQVNEELGYYEQYYTAGTGTNGITAHAYGKITYKEVYPGIDWVLYVKNGNVEYDFVVRPGADAGRIKLQYDGATSLKKTSDGGIAAVTPMGSISEKKPVAYESATGKAVAANFKLHNNLLSFETGKHNGTLTIDPVILWSTYFGGADEDVATCVKLSPGGNIYIGGYTVSTTLGFMGPGTTPHDQTHNGAYDAFITKYDQNGVRLFTTYFGNTGNERGTCIAGDAGFNNIFLGGSTQGSATLSTGGAYHAVNNGLIDGFVLRINNNGARQWSTYYGGTGNDYVNGIAVDAGSNVYITGRTESATLISSAGVFQTVLSGAADAFVAKFNGLSGTGTLIFSTYYGGNGVDEGYTVTTDPANNVYVGGQTTSITNIATPGAYQAALGGINDGFLGRLNTTGTTRAWGTYFGGPGTDQVTQIICRAATSDIGITGYTTSTSGIASANAQQTTYGGGTQDAFVGQFTGATGARTWSSYIGGGGLDYSESICLDPLGNLVIAGGTQSTNNISTPGSLQPALAGNFDAFSAKYVAGTGQRIWGSYFGEAMNDHAFGVICDGAGQIIMAGRTASTIGIATAGSAQPAFAGGSYDAFLTKFRIDTFALINQPFTDTLMCAGGPLTVAYTVNINYRAGNVFTAQLSNAAGSFAAPINIGSAVSSTSGTISCTIPAGTPAGTGYRIRITASAPAYISPDNFRNITIVASLPAVTLTSNSPVCVGNTLTLGSTATWSIATYVWNGPGGFIAPGSSTTRPSMTLADAGVYTLTTTHNGCPNNVSTVNVLVNDVIPTSPVAEASTINCNGGTLYLFVDTGIISTDTYSWTGPGGYTSTMQTPTISPLTAADGGSYSVTRTVDGCPSLPAVVTVTVTPNTPTGITIDVSPNDTVCGGTFVTFSSTPLNAGVSPLYQWLVNSMPVVGAFSPTWSSSTLNNGDAVSCIMTSNALCPAPANAVSNVITMNVITSELLVYIFATPGISVNPGDSVVFTSSVYNAGVGATYQWQRNNNDIPGATNATYTKHNITTYDTITLVVTSVMACVSPSISKSNALVVHPNTGVADVAAYISNIELFPNPNTGTFTLKCQMNGLDVNELSVTVVNAVGQVMHQENAHLTNGTLNKALNINNLVPGVYMLQLNAEGVNKTIRFSVQR